MTRPTTKRTKRKNVSKPSTWTPPKLATVVPIRPATVAPVAPVAAPLDPLRAPHRAIRTMVETHGHEAPQGLYEFFDFFNREFFDGLLGAPIIFLGETSSPRAIGDYTPKDIHGLVSRIRVHPAVFKMGWRQAAGTLLHEMLHAFQHEVVGDLELGYKGHGPLFAARANMIGARLGFPECSPKGRGGLAQAETWPHLWNEETNTAAPIRPRKSHKPAAPTIAPGPRDDSDHEPDSIDNATRERERRAIVAYIAKEARRVEKSKPKLAASWLNLATRIEVGAYEGDDDANE